MKRLALVCIVVLLSNFVAISAAAQSAASATIIGTVVDPQGAVVPGAKVTATNAATGVVPWIQLRAEITQSPI
jgi:hypothetical protein